MACSSSFLIHKGNTSENGFLQVPSMKNKTYCPSQNCHFAEIQNKMKLKIAHLDAINYFKQLLGIWTTISEEFRNCNIMKDLKYSDLKP